MKQTIRLNESQLRQIIKESIKKVLKEGYLNDADTDIREILANLAYDAIKQVMPRYADNFTAVGGQGNSCGVYTLLSPYDMNLSYDAENKFEEWRHRTEEYALECFLDDNPEYANKQGTDEFYEALDNYKEKYNFDSAVGRIEIHIQLEGAMEGRGWCMYDIKHVKSIQVSVNAFIFDEDDYNKTICSDTLYSKEIGFGDTEDDIEYFSEIPDWLMKEINSSLIEAATVISKNW